MMKAVIFDMDGVISDTEPGYAYATIDFMHELGLEVTSEYLSSFVGVTNAVLWQTVMKDFGFQRSIDDCIAEVDKRRAALEAKNGLHPLPGVIDLIKRFSSQGLLLAVASSNSMPEIMRVTDAFQIRHYFHALIAGTECAHSKPEPDIFLKAAESLKVSPEECLVIEDSANGILAAKRAGMKSIGFANPNFGSQNLSNATRIVTHFDQVTTDLCDEIFAS
jgi:HAD superfamily hydrolase (TIGR01509 family)